LQYCFHRIGGVHNRLRGAAADGTTDHGLPEVQASGDGHGAAASVDFIREEFLSRQIVFIV
jgi:hypothetical protein